MNSEHGRRIYEELGVKPVINAAGYMTVLGGSRVAPSVREASEAANRYFVDMEELLKRTGAILAEILGAEAALVTSGCAAAIALGAAACLSGSDPAKAERLPDTTGMKNEILVQASQRYKYDRCVTIFGGRLVEVGADGRTTAEQLAAAITNRTAAIHYFAPGGGAGVVPPEEVVRIAHQRGVPVLVDAASQVYPLEDLRKYTGMGADLVCYGAKYFGAYNSTGILCGRKDLVDAAFLHCFVGFESSRVRSVGRPLKVDRQEVIAVVCALREWVSMDHAARLAEHQRRIQVLRQALEGIRHVSVAPLVDERTLASGVVVTLDEAALGKTAARAIEELRAGNPSIWVRGRGDGNSFSVAVAHLVDGEEEIVARRLREVLAT
jgi:L-seryl-tRNA(Ser) seleniumtransferase